MNDTIVTIVGCDPTDPAPSPADWGEIKPLVLRYLNTAHVVMAARSKQPDALDASKTFAVPLTWQTDGTYAWPGALAYYAERHDQAPSADFLEHLRAAGFQPPAVDADAVARGGQAIRLA